MDWGDFWLILIACTATMWVSRLLPLLLLKDRTMPRRMQQALGFIPPAAFAALVANDLLDPHMFDAGIWPASIPLVAALAAAIVAIKSRSLLGTAIVGVGVYALLLTFFG